MKKTLFSLTIVVVTAIITLHYSCKREDPVFIKMYDLTINIDLSKAKYFAGAVAVVIGKLIITKIMNHFLTG